MRPRIARRLVSATLVAALTATVSPAAEPVYAPVPASDFLSVIAGEDGESQAERISAFSMRSLPVTNADFLDFVQQYPQWRRDRIAPLFADARYLAHWQGADQLGAQALPDQPVTQVSWFAARAYCASEGARLPDWLQWERVAAASASLDDARGDPAWRRHLLDWYGRPSTSALAAVGGAPNLYGVRDLHGLVWEWVEDYGAMMVAADSRDQDDPDRLKFCGAAALGMRDRDNYALLMRVAMLSSLQARDTTLNLGFRCVRDAETSP